MGTFDEAAREIEECGPNPLLPPTSSGKAIDEERYEIVRLNHPEWVAELDARREKALHQLSACRVNGAP